ncbi:MAG: hypothetical protein ACM37W_19605 [Actinomycetota bacterium]
MPLLAVRVALGKLAPGEDMVAIPGTKRRVCLKPNVGAVSVELPAADLDRINEVAPPGAAIGVRDPTLIVS